MALEAKAAAGCTYRGTYTAGETYTAGDLVTRSGGMWLCLQETGVAPGSAPEMWRLVVKSGQA